MFKAAVAAALLYIHISLLRRFQGEPTPLTTKHKTQKTFLCLLLVDQIKEREREGKEGERGGSKDAEIKRKEVGLGRQRTTHTLL